MSSWHEKWLAEKPQNCLRFILKVLAAESPQIKINLPEKGTDAYEKVINNDREAVRAACPYTLDMIDEADTQDFDVAYMKVKVDNRWQLHGGVIVKRPDGIFVMHSAEKNKPCLDRLDWLQKRFSVDWMGIYRFRPAADDEEVLDGKFLSAEAFFAAIGAYFLQAFLTTLAWIV